MSIRLLIFDLDGVLCDSCELHYQSFNAVLATINLTINKYEHETIYNGLPTREKLKLLTKYKNLSPDLYEHLFNLKQDYTLKLINDIIKPNQKLIEMFEQLKDYKIVCASNSIWKTVSLTLSALGILKYFDYFISNEEVKKCKPDPEMFYKCMERFGVSPNQTVIFEDSKIGRRAAYASGAHVCPILNSNDLTVSKVFKFIQNGNPITIVIPMAGKGSRFVADGYKSPKPLINIHGETMIEKVVKNINIKGRYIFIVQEEHLSKSLIDQLNLIAPNCLILPINYITEGAACSVLLAEEYINNDTPLIIANSDQFVEWHSDDFLAQARHLDACIVTFKSDDKKWSYAKVIDDRVVAVREKEVISYDATAGIYYYKKGCDFVTYAKQMMAKNIRVNNEFYVCPVFNEFLHKNIGVYECEKMWGLGTPDDLVYYSKHYLKLDDETIVLSKN